MSASSEKVNVTGHGKNPLLDYPIIPAINYEYQINIHPNQDGSSTVRVKGEYDGFPAHSVQVTDLENGNIYRPNAYTPEGSNLLDVMELLPVFGNENINYSNEK